MEGIYAAVSDVSSSTVEATVEGSEREVAIEKLILLRKCLASASKLVQSLMSWSGMTGAFSSTFPLRQQNPGGSFGNLFAPQWLQSRTGFSMCVSLGMLLYTFSYGAGEPLFSIELTLLPRSHTVTIKFETKRQVSAICWPSK